MKGKITNEDARRFLDEEELGDLKMLREEIELLEEGFDLPPGDRRRWEELRNKVARGRHSESEFKKYKKEIKEDASALKELRKEHCRKLRKVEKRPSILFPPNFRLSSLCRIWIQKLGHPK